MGRLRVTNGPLAGTVIDVQKEIVIGREDVDLEIDDAEVSRRHAAVRPLVGAIEVEDLASSNGTFVDGERIDAPTRVGGGAEIRLGTTLLAVEGVVPLDTTRVHGVPDATADPQATRIGAQPVAPVADPQATRARRVPDERVAAVAAADAAPALAPAGAAEPVGRGPSPAAQPVGTFSPPKRRRSSGLASRSWVPVVLSFGTVVLVAIALVIYFAAR
jgi:pSer/pThr/pTyr-binding forkhead associated (FHA) protein